MGLGRQGSALVDQLDVVVGLNKACKILSVCNAYGEQMDKHRNGKITDCCWSTSNPDSEYLVSAQCPYMELSSSLKKDNGIWSDYGRLVSASTSLIRHICMGFLCKRVGQRVRGR